MIAEFTINESKRLRNWSSKASRIYTYKPTGRTSRIKADLIKENSKTVLVRLADNKIIKRHKQKHNVIIFN